MLRKPFRIAKNDLAMRPIYHFNRKTIEGHILLCFMALAVSKYMEAKTNKSIKRIIELLRSITDAKIKNLLTEEIFILREQLPDEVGQLWKTLESF
jgi:transposase